MNSNSTHTREPIRIWVGALAFLLPFVSLITKSGVSLVSFLLLISVLISFTSSRNALLLALTALVAAIDLRQEPGNRARQALLAGVAALAGLAASVLTGTRGGWLALLPACVLLLRHARALDGGRMRGLLAAALALLT